MAASDPDQDYMAFLNKANEDPAKGRTHTATAEKDNRKKGFRTRQEGVEVPAPLLKVCGSGDAFYVSDADEPFEAVALAWDEAGRGLPDEGMFFSSFFFFCSGVGRSALFEDGDGVVFEAN
jgi:hypothetical protein